jgi:hypothetical protein
MARRNNNAGNALIDWVRPADADGPLVGAALSTYGLSLDQPDFFGQDFVPTLLGLGGVRGRGYSSPITLDRTLATCDVTLICDAHAVGGGARPTMRVDVLPIGHTVHHAKVFLIHRRNRVRLIVGSANLTHEGFRCLREMAVVLDFHEGGTLPPSVLRDAVTRWLEALGDTADEQVHRILNSAAREAERWPLAAPAREEVIPQLVFGGGPVPLWRTLVDAWPDGEPVHRWYVCSPFWPQVEQSATSSPFERIAEALQTKRAALNDCQLEIVTRADSASEVALPRFPFGLVHHLRQRGFPVRQGKILPARLDAADEEVPDGKAAENRDLHAKCVVLAGPRTTLVMVGSANFTHRGLGTLRNPKSANIEACVLLKLPGGRWEPEAWRPPIRGQAVDWATCSVGDLREPPEEETEAADWPDFILRIELSVHWEHLPEPHGELRVHRRTPGAVPFRVSFSLGDGESDAGIAIATTDSEVRVPIAAAQVRSALVRRVVRVSWGEPTLTAAFPVNVLHESKAAMPSVLGAKPSEEQLLAYFHGRISDEDLLARLEQQAHEGEQPAGFTTAADCERLRQLQSYLVREFVESLYGLSRTVQEGSFSPRAAEQALLGDLSPVSLAEQVRQALFAGRRSPTAAAFQLAELVRVVGELAWTTGSGESDQLRDALEQVRLRALDRLFAIVRQAAARAEFAAVLQDREFGGYARLLLPDRLARRWLALAPDKAPAAVVAANGEGA